MSDAPSPAVFVNRVQKGSVRDGSEPSSGIGCLNANKSSKQFICASYNNFLHSCPVYPALARIPTAQLPLTIQSLANRYPPGPVNAAFVGEAIK